MSSQQSSNQLCITLDEILTEQLYLLDEPKLIDRGLYVKRVPWHVINDSWVEFIKLYTSRSLHSVTPQQLKVLSYIQEHSNVGSAPLWPDSFINYAKNHLGIGRLLSQD